MTKPLPKVIYLVDRMPPESERYVTGRLRRMYDRLSSAMCFVSAHRRQPSKFKIYEGIVQWQEIDER